MERKDFLKSTLAFCGLSLVPAAVIESCTKRPTSGPSNVDFTIDLSSSSYAALGTVGGAVVAYSGQIVVINAGAGSYLAISNTCTHQGCTVAYQPSLKEFVCPCHGGTYSQTGAVISGPPPAALTQYSATLSGTILTIKS
jgi:cytochrome b6-f complex iron-sulfur subunit